MKKKEIFDNFKTQFAVEFFASVVLSFITLVITYHFKGEKGINEKVNSFATQIKLDSINTYFIGISIILSVVFFVLHYFFNTKYKTMLYKISNIYFNTFISIYRLIASFLLGFSALYVTYEHSFNAEIGMLCFYGFLSLFITAGLVIFLESINKRPERELKISSGIHSR